MEEKELIRMFMRWLEDHCGTVVLPGGNEYVEVMDFNHLFNKFRMDVLEQGSGATI